MASKLSAFIAHARSKDMDPQSIRMLLLSAGWKDKDISEALASEALDMPVPVPPDSGSAKDAFFHLLTFTTLYASVISLIVLAFQYIDLFLPDVALSQYSYDSSASTIRWFLAVLLVSGPLFLLLSRSLVHSGIRYPEKLHSGVRKWLTYLTLFVTACAVIGDGIALLFSFLQGDLTLPFLFKVLAIFLLTAGPFLYYFHTLRISAEEYASSSSHRYGFFSFLLVLACAVVLGFSMAGGPGYARLTQLDEARVNDLRTIQNQIYDMVYGPSRYNLQSRVTVLPAPLPLDLQMVQNDATSMRIRITDPATSEPYSYSVSGTRFTLCAVFDVTRDEAYDVFWNHPEGLHCYEFDALDPSGK